MSELTEAQESRRQATLTEIVQLREETQKEKSTCLRDFKIFAGAFAVMVPAAISLGVIEAAGYFSQSKMSYLVLSAGYFGLAAISAGAAFSASHQKNRHMTTYDLILEKCSELEQELQKPTNI